MRLVRVRARKWFAPACLGIALCLTGVAGAVSIEGAVFPEAMRSRGTDLVLYEAGLVRWMRLVKVYVAGLYLAPGAEPEDVLQDVPKRLEIEYLRGFSAEQFIKVTNAKIADNVDPDTFQKLRPQIDRLNSLYREVESRDRYALTYVPGAGTELALNGEPLGVVEGADFASAVFAIWLGPRPVDKRLKRKLLGAR
jgi:hypothetical protein